MQETIKIIQLVTDVGFGALVAFMFYQVIFKKGPEVLLAMRADRDASLEKLAQALLEQRSLFIEELREERRLRAELMGSQLDTLGQIEKDIVRMHGSMEDMAREVRDLTRKGG